MADKPAAAAANPVRQLLAAQAALAADMAKVPETALLDEIEAQLRDVLGPALNDVIRLAEAMPASRVASHVANLANVAASVRAVIDQRRQEIEQAAAAGQA